MNDYCSKSRVSLFWSKILRLFHIIVTTGTWQQQMAWIEDHQKINPMTNVAKGITEVICKGTSRKGKPSFANVGKGCVKRPLDNDEEKSSKTSRHHVQQEVVNCTTLSCTPPPPPIRPFCQRSRPPRLGNSIHVPSPPNTRDRQIPTNAAASGGRSFCARASAKAVDPEMTDIFFEEIVYVTAMTASQAAASAAAAAVVNALNNAYQVNVAVPSLPPLLPPTASPLHMQKAPWDDPEIIPEMKPQTPQPPPSAIAGCLVPQEVHCALPSSSQAEVGGQIEESSKKCDMSKNPAWNCQAFAIKGKDGEVHTKKGWKQLCAQCKKTIEEQKKNSADWLALQEP